MLKYKYLIGSRVFALLMFVSVGAAVLLYMQNSDLGLINELAQTRSIALSSHLLAVSQAGDSAGLSSRQDFPLFTSLSSVNLTIDKQFTSPGLMLREASFHPLPAQSGSVIGQMQINVSVKGRFLAMRQALTRLLAEHEELALKSLVVSRDGAADAAPRMEASLIFFYRK
jgi:hypothetical protein